LANRINPLSHTFGSLPASWWGASLRERAGWRLEPCGRPDAAAVGPPHPSRRPTALRAVGLLRMRWRGSKHPATGNDDQPSSAIVASQPSAQIG